MRFGAVPLDEARGAILAHRTVAADPAGPESLTYPISKGTVLTDDHLRDLAANDVRSVVVARLDPGDVGEDEAARRLADALQGAGLEIGAPGTGRVNLRAGHAGIVQIDEVAIDAVNRVDPGLTLATVPPWQRVGAEGLVATIKVIPFAVPSAALERACALAKGAMSLRGAQISTATLIETRTTADVPSDKGRRAIAARLAQFGVMLSERVVVRHEAAAIAAALAAAPGDVCLILTGSATCDARDVAPSGVRDAGGEVLHFGMPVDPGNLLFLGVIGNRPVIGLPGCARSPALNGADWVMERVICGVPLGDIDIAGMGVGGLLKEIPTRPHPRERR